MRPQKITSGPNLESVDQPEGEAKYSVDPMIELARNHGLGDNDLRRVEALIREHEQEIRDAWRRHFGS